MVKAIKRISLCVERVLEDPGCRWDTIVSKLVFNVLLESAMVALAVMSRGQYDGILLTRTLPLGPDPNLK